MKANLATGAKVSRGYQACQNCRSRHTFHMEFSVWGSNLTTTHGGSKDYVLRLMPLTTYISHPKPTGMNR